MKDDKMHISINKNSFKCSHDATFDDFLGQTHVQNQKAIV
jgi:hypothetical protein